MDRQRIKGGVKKGTGTIKEKAGKALGDRHLEGKGKAERCLYVTLSEGRRGLRRAGRAATRPR